MGLCRYLQFGVRLGLLSTWRLVGATITGSITLAEISAVYVSSSYPYWAGDITTVFGGLDGNLDYVISSRGVLYHYVAAIASFDMQITSNPYSQDNYHFWEGQVHTGLSLPRSDLEPRG